MTIIEFISLTGFEVTPEEYSVIEKKYHEFNGNKAEFCKEWVRNGGTQEVAYARAWARNCELESKLSEAFKENEKLKAQLLEQQQCKDETNARDFYNKLWKCLKRALSDDEIACHCNDIVVHLGKSIESNFTYYNNSMDQWCDYFLEKS